MQAITERGNDICDLCKNCRKLSITDGENNSISATYDKCSTWLRTTSFSDADSICSSEVSEKSETTISSEDSEGYGEDYTSGNKEIRVYGDVDNEHQLDLLFQSSVNTYRNVTISKSKNVHLGNVTYINGPVYINQTANIVNNQTIINHYTNSDTLDIQPPRIVNRRGWLAQPPFAEYEDRKEPAKFVIIAHSATEDATTQSDNILLVRLIQQFHIESRKWNDIGYNFLIGSDGNVYEGRGWTARGAHTYGFNQYSLGIAFVGTFINKLPPKVALNHAKQLIAYGVKIGAIAPDYQLLAHNQCSTTLSPGEMLVEEIKKWKNWNGKITVQNPPPEVIKED